MTERLQQLLQAVAERKECDDEDLEFLGSRRYRVSEEDYQILRNACGTLPDGTVNVLGYRIEIAPPFNIEDYIGSIAELVGAFNQNFGEGKTITESNNVGNQMHWYHTIFIYDDATNGHEQIRIGMAEFGRMLSECTSIVHRPLPIPDRDAGAIATLIPAALPVRLTVQYDVRGRWTGNFLYNSDGSPQLVDIRDEDTGTLLRKEVAKEYKSGIRVNFDILAEFTPEIESFDCSKENVLS